MPRAWTHLTAIAAHRPIALTRGARRRGASTCASGSAGPGPPTWVTATAEGAGLVPPWEVGYDPEDAVDRAVMATREAVFPAARPRHLVRLSRGGPGRAGIRAVVDRPIAGGRWLRHPPLPHGSHQPLRLQPRTDVGSAAGGEAGGTARVQTAIEVAPWPTERQLAEVRFLTVAEVASIMRVSKMTVYRLVHAGELPAIRVGRSFRVPENAVHEYLRTSFVDTA